jgi:hypothetical protein
MWYTHNADEVECAPLWCSASRGLFVSLYLLSTVLYLGALSDGRCLRCYGDAPPSICETYTVTKHLYPRGPSANSQLSVAA